MAVEHSTVRTEVIKAIRHAYWPLIVVAALTIFSSDIRSLLSRVGQQLDRATSVAVSGITISLSPATLPAPPSDIAAILPKLDREAIRLILSTDPGAVTNFVCSVEEDNPAFDDLSYPDLINTAKLLKDLGLISSYDVPTPIDPPCKHQIRFKPTPTLKVTKTYLINVLQSLVFRSAA
jgi:hypothetical protein